MNLADALTKKLNEDSANANLVSEISARLASNLAVHMQEHLPRTDGVKLLAQANEDVSSIVQFYRSGGHIAKMSEPTLGKFLAIAEGEILNQLCLNFSKAFAVIEHRRAQTIEARRVVELMR
jgi:hypothetical protein